MSLSKPRRIEVFVVGGLIFGLWLVMFVTFERMRNYKRGALCQSHLKQIALASKQYERDYDEHFPLSKNWTIGLFPYHKSPAGFHCPSALKDGYAINKHLNALTHSQLSPHDSQQIPQYFETQKLQQYASGAGEIWLTKPRHPQGVGVAFLDGHVGMLQQKPVFRSFETTPRKVKTKSTQKGKARKIY